MQVLYQVYHHLVIILDEVFLRCFLSLISQRVSLIHLD